MELTILLSKVFGIYLIIGGIAYISRQRFFMSVVHDFVNERALRVIVAAAELIAGLFLVFNHNVWGNWQEGLVSLLGWLMLAEGVFYLLLPESVVRAVIKMFNVRGWYIGGGLVSIIAGLYLAGTAFGVL